MLYEIKQLEWEKEEVVAPDIIEKYKSYTSICSFEIEKVINDKWYYHYCFDEYYDDGSGSCKGLNDGKAKCEEIWEEKLKKCLVEKG